MSQLSLGNTDWFDKHDDRLIPNAVISDCGKYRYCLNRRWDNNKPSVLFIMLNPSTADASNDDPTIRRCVGFAKEWGYGGLYVGNLFPYRSTDPKELLKCENPLGDLNLTYLRVMSTYCDRIICAWGNSPIVNALQKKFHDYKPLKFINKELYYLELSNDGTPKHPLYLKKSIHPTKFEITQNDNTSI